jgi:putative membrane protein
VIVVSLVFAALAALLHIYIFVLESLMWTSVRARGVFGLTIDEARATQGMAFNQGFYNLFLAIVAAVGIGLVAVGPLAVGAALVFAGAGSMFAAALVLFLSAPDKRGAALKQGLLPLLAVTTLAIGAIGG